MSLLQVLVNLTKPYSKCTLAFLARELDLLEPEVEGLLVDMIMDGRLQAQIDQIGGYVTLSKATKTIAASTDLIELFGEWAHALNQSTDSLTNRSMQ